jgi:hypothetical protein
MASGLTVFAALTYAQLGQRESELLVQDSIALIEWDCAELCGGNMELPSLHKHGTFALRVTTHAD